VAEGLRANANGVHYHVVFNYHLAGEEITYGTKYVLNEAKSVDMNVRPGAVGETTRVDRFLLVGQGQAPDYVIRATSHMTINENGETTVEFARLEIECR